MKILESYLKKIDQVILHGKYKDNWESLAQYEVPKWYKSAKFGLFSHYGLYNVPEYGSEWYSRNMYVENSETYLYHKEKFGSPKEYGYKKFINEFKSEKFNAQNWMEIIKQSGAKYFIPVAEHHDGFQMYESYISEYNSKKMGPKKNYIKELQEQAINKKIEFGVSSHRAEHFFFMSGGRSFDSDIVNPQYGDLYWPSLDEDMFGVDKITTKLFLEDWLCRCCELVDLFSPKIVYFDWWIEMSEFIPYLQKFLAYFYNKSESIYGNPGVVNYKHDGVPYLLAVRDMERGQFNNVQYDYWQCCTSISRDSWSHTLNHKVKSSREIIEVLIDVVSKNGNLLLNFCPHKDGYIVEQEINILSEIGDWLQTNGRGIFDTHPWKVFGEGDTNVLPGDFGEVNKLSYRSTDFRFTQNANSIFVFIMKPSYLKTFRIFEFGLRKRNLKWHNKIESITLLSSPENIIEHKRYEDYMEINFLKELTNNIECIEFKFK